MKNLSSLLLPFALLLALLGLTYWLQQITDLPEVHNTSKERHDPDTRVEKFTIKRLDGEGKLKYVLTGEQLTHYGDDESSEVTRPHLTYHRPEQPQVTLAGDRGWINKAGDEVKVNGHVVSTRAAYDKRPALVAKTENLLILPEAGTAHTDDPVQITEGESWANGIGMDMDSKAQLYSLNSRVRALRANPERTAANTPPAATPPFLPASILPAE